jgi:hypothetical protein
MVEAATAYGLIGFEAMVACFCSAALPPCPAPGDPRVPLALVKVRRRDCHIVSVCNWTPLRKHVLTFRNLAYWWGWIPFVQFIREGMHAICCDLLGLVQHVPQPKAPVADHPEAVEANPAGQPMNAALQMHPLSAKKFDTSLFQAVAIRVMAGGGPTVGDLVNTAFSKQRLTIDPTLTPDERQVELVRLADTAPLKLLGGMFAGAGPMLGGVLAAAGPALGGLGEGLGARVHADLAELKATVERQSAEIEALRARLDEH